MKKLNFLALILATLMLALPVLAACDGNTEESSTSSSSSSSISDPPPESSAPPKYNYGGKTFTILSSGVTDENKVSSGFLYNDYPSGFEGERTPDLINDAYAERNNLVEAHLNIVIEEEYFKENSRPGGILPKIRNELISGGEIGRAHV